jgi:hypothetical protein
MPQTVKNGGQGSRFPRRMTTGTKEHGRETRELVSPSVLKQIGRRSTGPRINVKRQLELSWGLVAGFPVPPRIRRQIHRRGESVMREPQPPREQGEANWYDFQAGRSCWVSKLRREDTNSRNRKHHSGIPSTHRTGLLPHIPLGQSHSHC